MDCSKVERSLHDYASGSLNGLETQAVAKHLEKCEKCRREAEEILSLRRFFSGGSAEAAVPDEGLKLSIMAAVDLNRYKPVRKTGRREMTNWGLSLVAAGLILLLVNISPAGGSLMERRMDIFKTEAGIAGKLEQPFSAISDGLNSVTSKIIELDGISGRLEKQKKGGN